MHIAIRTGWIMGSLLVAGLASAAGNAPLALEAEMKRIVAERQIFEVISRYSHMWDSKNPSGLADLFTEDGVWDRWGPGVQKPDISLKGREALREYTAERFRTNLADRQTRHYQTNTIILDLTDDTAHTRTVFVVTHVPASEKSPRVVTTGIYEDEFRRTGGGWRISHRVLRADN
jgi:uncharacterized protein (TIGR02246 family)